MSYPDKSEGFAFPFAMETTKIGYHATTGMTLRDYFAAKVLQGELAAQNSECGFWNEYSNLSEHAYRIADLMLKARES